MLQDNFLLAKLPNDWKVARISGVFDLEGQQLIVQVVSFWFFDVWIGWCLRERRKPQDFIDWYYEDYYGTPMVKSFLSEKDSNKPVEAGFHDVVCSSSWDVQSIRKRCIHSHIANIFFGCYHHISSHPFQWSRVPLQVICVLDGHGNDGHWPAMRMTVTWVSEKSDREWLKQSKHYVEA